MAKPVCMGAMLQCSFGMAPATLNVLDPMRPKLQSKPIANIAVEMDSEILLFAGVKPNSCESTGRIGCTQ